MADVVIGSGPSGANAALTLLQRGRTVELWDVGLEEPAAPAPEATFDQLKAILPDPHAYLLGNRFEAVIAPAAGSLLEYPPARAFMLRDTDSMWPAADGRFHPVLSYNRGGLGVGWGANALAYDEDDFAGFPVGLDDYREAYAEAFRRVPVAGPQHDGLSAFLPAVHVSQSPLGLNEHDGALYAAYARKAHRVNKRFNVHIGLARMAVRTAADDSRACRYCARCLWGCPVGAIYNPAQDALSECARYTQFRYRPRRLVLRLEAEGGRVHAIRYRDLDDDCEHAGPCDRVFLAAGAIQTGAIMLRTVGSDATLESRRSDLRQTRSLMDTRVVKIPYVQLRAVGQRRELREFQFNRLIMAHIRSDGHAGWPRYVHGEILSLNSLLYHPLIESLPFGTRVSKEVFFRLKSALGAVTLFLPDRQERGSGMSLVPDTASLTGDRIRFTYEESPSKRAVADAVIHNVTAALRALGCYVRPAQIQTAPAGAGIHYAGTVPMGPSDDPLCVSATGRSNAYHNVYVADGAAFPMLPSKSITMSLIAHAIRTTQLAA